MSTTTHEFSLILSGKMTDGIADALYGAGADDALVSIQCGVPYVDFDRDATSFEKAVLSAIRDVERTGLKVLRVEPDDLVSVSEIARRTSRSRESIRLLSQGERGRGGFPPPISGVLTKAPLWRWSEVARWFSEDEDSEAFQNATAIAAINNVLDLRSRQIPKRTVDGLWRQLTSSVGVTGTKTKKAAKKKVKTRAAKRSTGRRRK